MSAPANEDQVSQKAWQEIAEEGERREGDARKSFALLMEYLEQVKQFLIASNGRMTIDRARSFCKGIEECQELALALSPWPHLADVKVNWTKCRVCDKPIWKDEDTPNYCPGCWASTTQKV